MACFSLQDIGQCGCACSLSVTVRGCLDGSSAAMTCGSGLTVNLKVGGSTVYTGTTNSSGVAAITGTAGTYDVEVVDGRTPSRWNTQTFTSQSLTCGGSTTVTVNSVKSGFHCTERCGEPFADTLYATDPNGTWTLTYAGSGAIGAGWYGCATKTSMASVVTSLAAGTCVKTTGTANVDYVIAMPAAGTNIQNIYGGYDAPPATTTSTSTCSGGAMNYNAGIPVSCIGSITSKGASANPSWTCPPALSLTATMPSTGSSSTSNPGAGSITVTE